MNTRGYPAILAALLYALIANICISACAEEAIFAPSASVLPEAIIWAEDEAPVPADIFMQTMPPDIDQPLRSARIRAVGDLMMHAKQLDIAKQSDGTYDFHPQYALIADSLADADYTIANLETTIGKYKSMAYSGYPLFNAPEALLDAVRDAGIDFLTLANNHMLDRYFEGLMTTIDRVREYGFDYGGANRTAAEKGAPVLVDVNGIRIGMICCTEMTNGMESYCTAEATQYGVEYIKNINFPEKVQKLRSLGADIVIALPHWGDEYNRQPDSRELRYAKMMVAAGVDVILASHPHMVQPIKWITAETESGEEHTALVAYCLGNFISNMTKKYTDSGIILEFTVQEKSDGSFAIENVAYVPIYCWKQDKMIRAISSSQYYEEAPEGMSGSVWSRMKASCEELIKLMGDAVPILNQ